MTEDAEGTPGVVLVTGASRGIGRAAALAFHEAGAAVGLVARDATLLESLAEEIRARGGRAVDCPADVADPSAADACLERVERELGPVAVTVNSAGISKPFGRTWEVDPVEWLDLQRVNVGGVFLFTRASLQRMVPRGRGVVINVSSGVARNVAALRGAYATSKAAVDHLSRIAAAEAREFGVHVFSVYPGMVDTDMQREMRDTSPDLVGEETHRAFVQRYEEGQLFTPERVAAALVRLASQPSLAGGEVIVRLDQVAPDPARSSTAGEKSR